MKYLTYAFYLLLTCLFVISCDKRSEMPVQLDVRFDEWTDGPGLRLRLSGEINDSRCPHIPANPVDCFWQGQATGTMVTEIGNTVHNIPYTIEGICHQGADPCGNFVDTLGYKFQFLFLAPYPDGTDPNVDYVLSVEVEKK